MHCKSLGIKASAKCINVTWLTVINKPLKAVCYRDFTASLYYSKITTS